MSGKPGQSWCSLRLFCSDLPSVLYASSVYSVSTSDSAGPNRPRWGTLPSNRILLQHPISQQATLATIQSVKPETKTPSDRALSLTLIISHQIRAMSPPNTQTWPPFFSPTTVTAALGPQLLSPGLGWWLSGCSLYLHSSPLQPPLYPGARLIFSSVMHYFLCKV